MIFLDRNDVYKTRLVKSTQKNKAQQIKNNVQILVQGINELDQEVKQKTFEVQNPF